MFLITQHDRLGGDFAFKNKPRIWDKIVSHKAWFLRKSRLKIRAICVHNRLLISHMSIFQISKDPSMKRILPFKCHIHWIKCHILRYVKKHVLKQHGYLFDISSKSSKLILPETEPWRKKSYSTYSTYLYTWNQPTDGDITLCRVLCISATVQVAFKWMLLKEALEIVY